MWRQILLSLMLIKAKQDKNKRLNGWSPSKLSLIFKTFNGRYLHNVSLKDNINKNGLLLR